MESCPLDQLYVSVVTIAEIRFGIDGRVLPLTEDVVLRWRLLVEQGRKRGHTYSQPDLFIAATALLHGFTVVTRDRSEYETAGAPVLNPWDAA
ncbi:MAG TPA: PIN domain-containing protein [Bryobacteraceae bacterium]|nr:PIN domain-containing protein [Bryobacteraceae bacterium]